MKNKNLNIKYLDPKSLTPYERNSRKHSTDQINRIAKSIEQFGFLNPVIIKNNQIIAGHARVEAAVNLGMANIPTVEAGDLSDLELKAYVIADNRLAELSEWDNEILKFELEDLRLEDFNLELIGFDNIDNFFGNKEKNIENKEINIENLTSNLNKKCPKCGFEFE